MGLDAPTRRAVDVITYDAFMGAVAELEATSRGKRQNSPAMSPSASAC
jgi:hypothetical protein